MTNCKVEFTIDEILFEPKNLFLMNEMGEHLLKSRPDLHSSLMTSRGDFSV